MPSNIHKDMAELNLIIESQHKHTEKTTKQTDTHLCHASNIHKDMAELNLIIESKLSPLIIDWLVVD